MHTKEYWLLFFCVTVYCTHCWVTTVSPTRCQLIETPPEKNRATAIGNTPESLAKIKRVVHHHHHHHHLFAQINWPRRRSHDQHENKSRTRKAQKTGAYILPIKNKHTRYKNNHDYASYRKNAERSTRLSDRLNLDSSSGDMLANRQTNRRTRPSQYPARCPIGGEVKNPLKARELHSKLNWRHVLRPMHVEGTTAPSGESSGNAPALISLSLSGLQQFFMRHISRKLSLAWPPSALSALESLQEALLA